MDPFQETWILALLLSVFKGRHMNSCNVRPNDLYVGVGSDFNVSCRTSCVSGKVYWTLDKKRLDERLSDTTQPSLSVLSLSNFTQHKALLECHSENLNQILGGTIITTYTKPSKISCIWHYDPPTGGVPQLFTCNWEHEMNLVNSTISYTLFVSSPNGTQRAMCHSKKTTCKATGVDTSGSILLANNISVTVRAKTDTWEATSDPCEFYPYHILKIIPPKPKVSVESDHLWIVWKRPTAGGKRKINCQVKYTKTVGNEASEVYNSTLKHEEDGNVTIKVDSCTNYKVSVRCALDSAPWSDWSQETTALTGFNKSDVRLHLWRTITNPNTDGIRKVHAMWRQIPATCEGAFTYTIQLVPYEQHTTGVNYTQTLCSNSTCSVDVNEDQHRIDLTVFHDDAIAKDSVYVPAAAESLPRVTEIQTAAVEGVVRVSWTAPAQPVRGYMVDWTHDGNQYYWMESEYTNTSLFGLLDKKQYNITVTPLFDDKTGRGSQAVRICSRIGDPDDITIDKVQANYRNVTVSWMTKSQVECSGAVISYTVVYTTQAGLMHNVTVDSTERDVLIENLNPDTKYSIYINATASNGTSGSNVTHFQTLRYDPRMITVLKVSGSVVIILVLFLGLCCTIQCKKFREKPVPNPAHSSLATWLLPYHQKGMCLFQAFSNPSESFCDRVYTEEMQKTPPRPSARGCYPASDEAEQCNAPTTLLKLDLQDEKPDDHVETHLFSSGESTELLSQGRNSSSPYRSQGSVKTPNLRTIKKSERVPAKQPEKKTQMTVYFTLNMLKEGPMKETDSNTKIQEYVSAE